MSVAVSRLSTEPSRRLCGADSSTAVMDIEAMKADMKLLTDAIVSAQIDMKSSAWDMSIYMKYKELVQI